jgi:peptidoglycan-associated lipoprotein
VRNYLLSLGISDGRLEAVSYGEEKPVDPGHEESAWVKNRRVEFVPMS